MKIAMNQEITVEFDTPTFERAAAEVVKIKKQWQDAEEVLDAMFAVLAFRAIEQATPGKIDQLLKACAMVRPELAVEVGIAEAPAEAHYPPMTVRDPEGGQS